MFTLKVRVAGLLKFESKSDLTSIELDFIMMMSFKLEPEEVIGSLNSIFPSFSSTMGSSLSKL